jgi:hypothetical protein
MSNQNIPSYQMEDYDSSDGAGASGYVENESKKRDMEEVPLSEVANIPFDSHRPSSQYDEKDPYQYGSKPIIRDKTSVILDNN